MLCSCELTPDKKTDGVKVRGTAWGMRARQNHSTNQYSCPFHWLHEISKNLIAPLRYATQLSMLKQLMYRCAYSGSTIFSAIRQHQQSEVGRSKVKFERCALGVGRIASSCKLPYRECLLIRRCWLYGLVIRRIAQEKPAPKTIMRWIRVLGAWITN